jgi:hypothetical protein
MDQLNKLKSDLFTKLQIQYKNLINELREMPIAEVFKNPGFMNLDQGIMWFEKGIHLLQVETTAPSNSEDKTPKIDEGACYMLCEDDPNKLN